MCSTKSEKTPTRNHILGRQRTMYGDFFRTLNDGLQIRIEKVFQCDEFYFVGYTLYESLSIKSFASTSVCARLETSSSSNVTGFLSGSAIVFPHLITLSALAS